MNRQPKQIVRAAARRSIFADGKIVSESGSVPVRIRNMSEAGALVDCSGEPPGAGEVVHLEKGALSLLATVSWSKGSRAGLTFAVEASLAEWLPKITDRPKRSDAAGRRAADSKPKRPQPAEAGRLERDRAMVARLAEAATLLDSVLKSDLVDKSPRRRGPTASQQVECSLAIINELIDVVGRRNR